jgi:alpha-glucoside transport system permease protein
VAIKILNAVLAIVGGIGGAMIIFWILNKLAESLKGQVGGPGQTVDVRRARDPRDRGLPHLPRHRQTINYSFANEEGTKYVGLTNYTDLLTEATSSCNVLLNNLLWIIIVPALTVILGLGVAVLADRLQPRGREGEQDDHLPADGHQHGRRGDDLALDLRVPADGRAADRSAQRDHGPVRP